MEIKKLKRRNFWHLTDHEFENPLFPLVELCCSETSLTYVVDDTNRFIRAANCDNRGFSANDFGEMHFIYERFLKHIELLYIYQARYPDWTLADKGPLYRAKVIGLLREVHDEDMFGGTTMRFDSVTETEFWDLGVFMKNFFAFKNLDEWRDILDDLIRHILSEEVFSQDCRDATHIFEYLDKLSEAMFLAYLIRGKDYMLAHCAERFGIKRKKLVDA